MVGWLVGWLVVCLFGRWVDCLFGRLVGWLVGYLVSYLASYKQLMHIAAPLYSCLFPTYLTNEEYTISGLSGTPKITVTLPDNFFTKMVDKIFYVFDRRDMPR